MDKQQSRREALAMQLQDEWFRFPAGRDWLAVADFILAEQERREGPLVKMLEHAQSCGLYGSSCMDMIKHTLAAYHAIDAPPQRTVEQIAADVEKHSRLYTPGVGEVFKCVPAELLDELAAALKRAEGERNAEGVKRGKE